MVGEVLLLVAVVSAGGGATLNYPSLEKWKDAEYYRVFDIKTHAGRDAVIEAARSGLEKNVGDAQHAHGVTDYQELPATPGRFRVVGAQEYDQQGSGGGKKGFKTAVCDGAVWTASADKSVDKSFDLRLTTCLFEYQEGYHLDLYAHLLKKEGGAQTNRPTGRSPVVTPEEWMETTFLDVVKTIRNDTSAGVKLLEGYPGTPWLASEAYASAK